MDLLRMFSPRTRAAIYLAVTIGAAVYGAYTASEGDWLLTVGTLLVSLQGLMARSNIDFAQPDGAHEQVED